jgi:hypothetical protein
MDSEGKNKEKVETNKMIKKKFLIRVLESETLDLNTPNSLPAAGRRTHHTELKRNRYV